jgi:hypothetical protein
LSLVSVNGCRVGSLGAVGFDVKLVLWDFGERATHVLDDHTGRILTGMHAFLSEQVGQTDEHEFEFELTMLGGNGARPDEIVIWMTTHVAERRWWAWG